MELEFSTMKEKVTKKMMGVSLSYKDVKANNWNLPKDFKMPKIKKYKGMENPQNHASHYLLMMTPFNLSIEHIALLFSQTLDDTALEWYHGLTTTMKKDWDALIKAFVKQYDYVAKIQVTLADLEAI